MPFYRSPKLGTFHAFFPIEGMREVSPGPARPRDFARYPLLKIETDGFPRACAACGFLADSLPHLYAHVCVKR